MELYLAHLAALDPKWNVDGNDATTPSNVDAALDATESAETRLGRLRGALSDEAADARFRQELGRDAAGGSERRISIYRCKQTTFSHCRQPKHLLRRSHQPAALVDRCGPTRRRPVAQAAESRARRRTRPGNGPPRVLAGRRSRPVRGPAVRADGTGRPSSRPATGRGTTNLAINGRDAANLVDSAASRLPWDRSESLSRNRVVCRSWSNCRGVISCNIFRL